MASRDMREYWESEEWVKMKVDLIVLRGEKCEWCGKKTPALVPHHLTYENFKDEKPEDLALICTHFHAVEHGKIKPKKKRKTRAQRKEDRLAKKKRRKPGGPETWAKLSHGCKRICPDCDGVLVNTGSLWSCYCGYSKAA